MSLTHRSCATRSTAPDARCRDSASRNPSERADVSPPCPVNATGQHGGGWDGQRRSNTGDLRPPLAAVRRAEYRWAIGVFALLLMCVSPVLADDAPVDVHCGPRCVKFLTEYLSLPDEELSSVIAEFEALDQEPGITLQQLARALERRGLTVSAYNIPPDSMIESDAPVVLHLNPLGSNSLGHFSILLPTSTPTHSDVWVGVEGVQSGSPLELRPQMSGEVLVVSQLPSQTAVRRLSPLRMTLADNYHWLVLALPGLVLILIAVLLSRLRAVPEVTVPVSVPVEGELT